MRPYWALGLGHRVDPNSNRVKDSDISSRDALSDSAVQFCVTSQILAEVVLDSIIGPQSSDEALRSGTIVRALIYRLSEFNISCACYIIGYDFLVR